MDINHRTRSTGDPVASAESRRLAERLFDAFRAAAPFRRGHRFGADGRPGEFQLIHRLFHDEAGSGTRVGDLAAWLGVKPPTVSQLVDSLEARGLVERCDDALDRRAKLVRLSPAGRAMADGFHERAILEFQSIVEHLGLEDGAKLAELLSKAAAFMAARANRCADRNRNEEREGSC